VDSGVGKVAARASSVRVSLRSEVAKGRISTSFVSEWRRRWVCSDSRESRSRWARVTRAAARGFGESASESESIMSSEYEGGIAVAWWSAGGGWGGEG